MRPRDAWSSSIFRAIIPALGIALASSVSVSAQMIDNPVFGDFEINTAGSLEQDLLDQIRLSGRVTADQFPRLTRLIMLEAYAMHQNVRADLRTSQMGFNLEYQTLALFNSAQDLDAYVRTTAELEPAGTIELRDRFSDILRIYQTIDNSLGQLPGFSPSASRHFTELTQLLSIVNAVIAPSAPNGTTTRTRDAPGDAGRLNELAGYLVTELERMDFSTRAPSAPGSVAPTFRDDQNTLVRMVQGFQRLLAAGPTTPEIVETWRVIRTRMWEFERRIQQQSDHPDWRRGLATRETAVRRHFGPNAASASDHRIGRLVTSHSHRRRRSRTGRSRARGRGKSLQGLEPNVRRSQDGSANRR